MNATDEAHLFHISALINVMLATQLSNLLSITKFEVLFQVLLPTKYFKP